MSTFKLSEDQALYYEHVAPTGKDGYTFVFFNAITADSSSWEAVIGPKLREAGHGTLVFNFRGQKDSPFDASLELTNQLIVDDAMKLLEELKPSRAMLVGLSIGGLFAAQCVLAGFEASGLVLINTLRVNGPRIQWVGDAMIRASEIGGLELIRDLMMPLLANQGFLAANRANFLQSSEYTPIARDDGHYKLLSEGTSTADWGIDWSQLKLPSLVITGLQDHIFFEAADVDRLAASMPNCTRVDMADAGHLAPIERPEAVIAAMLDFAEKA